jgi:hypothetical protein
MVRDACSAHSDGCRCEWCTFLVAATPAEQAHPTGRDLDICARPKCKSPRHYNIHDPERGGHVFVEAAEQAQGEGANFWAGPICTKTHAIGAACDCDPVAALAKRVDALTVRLDRIASPPPCPFVSEVKRHWDDPAVRDNFVDATLDDHEYRMRDLEWRFKTQPEAAGPGWPHEYVNDGKKRCEVCGLPEVDDAHAVPPIPEGGAR